MARANWQEVFFQNRQAETLAGLFLPVPRTANTGTLIICHGFTGSKEGGGHALTMAESFASLGISCLVFDFSGHGSSEGKFEQTTLSKQIQDLRSAIDFCRARGAQKIITMGRSVGAATVLAHGAKYKDAAGICLWACPANPYRLFQGFVNAQQNHLSSPLITLKDSTGEVKVDKGFFTDLQHYDLLSMASEISPRPLLLIHGLADGTVPPTDSAKLYARALDPKSIHLLPGENHRFQTNPSKVWDICHNWLSQLSAPCSQTQPCPKDKKGVGALTRHIAPKQETGHEDLSCRRRQSHVPSHPAKVTNP